MTKNELRSALPRWACLVLLCAGLAGCATLDLPAPDGAPAPRERPATAAEPAAPAATPPTASDEAEVPAAPLPGIWERVRAGFTLPHHADRPRVEKIVRHYARNPEAFQALLERGRPYLYLVLEAVEQRGLPTELALLPFIESAYTPDARSHRRAAGLWQFMPATGAHYGLNRNWWYDGRHDVLSSTEAALRHLESLHRRFDDWLLALAAYNMGGNGLERRLPADKNRASYWNLRLPRETARYVPKLLALAAVLSEPDRYGLSLPDIPDAPQVRAVDLDGQIDLHVVAKLAQVEPAVLYGLNTGFLQRVTAPDGPHRLLVPLAASERIKAHLAALPREQWVQWRRYRIRRGDALSVLARRFGTTVEALRAVNGLRGNHIVAVDTLLIPQSGGALAATAGDVVHTVRAGDSLWSLSRQYGVPMRVLAAANDLAAPEHLRIGQTLRIPRQAPATTLSMNP